MNSDIRTIINEAHTIGITDEEIERRYIQLLAPGSIPQPIRLNVIFCYNETNIYSFCCPQGQFIIIDEL